MNPQVPPPIRLTETYWRGIILTLSIAVILLTVWCLTHGITTIFMHLYYFPIVLLAYRYRWKGCGLATLLALAYLGLVIVFDAGQTDVILGAVYRFLVFVGIAAVIAYLADQLAQAQNRLQQSAELRDRYLSLAPAIILALDRNGAITFLNQKGGEILECLPDEAMGKPWVGLFIPEKDRDRVREVFGQLMAGQVEQNRIVENPVLTPGGTEKLIRWFNTVLHDENGAITGILGFGEDITGEKRAQDTLHTMQQFQESVIANANVWISVLAPDGTLLVWNDAAEAISGYKKIGVLGKNTVWKQLYPDNEYRKKVTGDIRRIIGRDTFLENFETEIRCADGTKKTIVWNTRGLRDNDGAITSYIAIGRDITRQSEAEAENRHLASFPRLTPVNILESDLSGRILFTNPAMKNTIAAIGIPDPGIFIPTDFLEKAGAESPGTPPVLSERELVIQNRTFTLNLSFVSESRSVRVYATDITQRKQAEDALKESETLLNEVSEMARVGGWELDVRTKAVRWTQETYRIHDISEDEKFDLSTAVTFFDLPDRSTLESALQRCMEKEEPFDLELPFTSAKGRHLWTRAMGRAVKSGGEVVKLMGTFQDITERKRVEHELRQAFERFKTVMNSIDALVYVVDMHTYEILFINKFGKDIWGEIEGKVCWQTIQAGLPGPCPFCTNARLIDAAGNPTGTYVWEFRNTVNGHWYDCRDSAIPWTHGRLVRMEIAIDITERKRVEENLKLSNVLLSTQQEVSIDGILVVDGSGKIISFNKRFIDIWGILSDVIASGSDERALQSVIEKLADPEEFFSRVKYLYANRDEKSREEIVLKDGRVFERYSAPMVGNDGIYYGRVWNFRDITERKRVELELASAYVNLKEAYRLAHIGTWNWVMENDTVTWSEELYTISGRDPSLPAPTYAEMPRVYTSASWERLSSAVTNALTTGEPYNLELEMLRPDGSIRWINAFGGMQRDATGKVIGLHGTLQDITERKRAEEALQESESFNRGLVENLPDYIIVYGSDGKILYVNPATATALGYDADTLVGTSVLSYVAEEHRDEVISSMKIRHEGREVPAYETDIVAEDGSRRSVIAKGTLIRYHDIPAFLILLTDITERKQAEAAIRSREEQFSVIFHNQQTGLIMVDAATHTIADANAAALSMIGASREDVIGKVCHTFICPAEKGKCPVTDLGHTVDNSERVLIRANGDKIPILKSVNKVTIGGRPFLIESFIDLTERKQMEKQVSESRQLFADIISFLPDPTFVIDKEGKVLAWNRAIEQLSGIPARDIIGKGDHEYSLWLYGKRRPILIDLVLHPDQDFARVNYTAIQVDGQTVTDQTRIVLLTGRNAALSLVASPLFDAQGAIVGAIESMRDITHIKETEAELERLNQNLEETIRNRTQALAESERKYRTLFDKTKDAYLIIENNKFVDCNAATLEMLGYKTREELFKTHPSSLSPPTQPDGRSSFEKAEEMMATALRDGSNRFEWVHRRANGEDFWVEVSLTAIPIQDHQIIHTAWRDITDRKKAEAEILASLEQKVVLLREIHHRVNNNLQIIISLINLQMRQTGDPEVKQIISETQNRVRAMSLVYEKLYRSESLSRIDFADYTRYLATQLFSFYGTDTRKVRLDFAMGKIMVDINTAVPLGLIMNEFISNALRHAFPDGREGTISISGGDVGDLITLVVHDNGIGIPEGFDWKNTTTLGMRLVTSLVDQVDGTIERGGGEGTTFIITIQQKRDPAPS